MGETASVKKEDDSKKEEEKADTKSEEVKESKDEPVKMEEDIEQKEVSKDDVKEEKETTEDSDKKKIKIEKDEDGKGDEMDVDDDKKKGETKEKADGGEKEQENGKGTTSETPKRSSQDTPEVEVRLSKRSRRASKTSTYQPEDFKRRESAITIFRGRGEKLGDIPAVKESIEKHSPTSDELMAAHRFLYITRGKVAKKDMKTNVLEFSGFLKYKDGTEDEKAMKKDDENMEKKYAKKAYSQNVPHLKMLCDFFTVDRTNEVGKQLGKDDLIDRLLDFLGAPSEDMLKSSSKGPGSAKKKTPTKRGKSTAKKTPSSSAKKKKRVRKAQEYAESDTEEDEEESTDDEEEEAEEDDKGDFSLVKKLKKGEKPTDKALRQWVRAYVICFNMDSATTKHALKTASDKFGVDLGKHKDRIKELLAEEM